MRLFIFLTLSLISAIAFSATYYVDGDCANNGDGTADSCAASGGATGAWNSIATANSNLASGDTVRIHAGTYNERIRPAANVVTYTNNGATRTASATSEADRITYENYGDGDVILTQNPTAAVYTGFDFGNVALGARSYITVNGIDVIYPWGTRTRSFGNMVGSDHIIVENCEFRGPANRGWGMPFWLSEGNIGYPIETFNNVFRNNIVQGSTDFCTNSETEDLFEMGSNTHHNLIEGSEIYNSGHTVYAVKSGVTKNVIRNNNIANEAHTALEFYPNPAGENIVEGNVLSANYDVTSWPCYPDATPQGQSDKNAQPLGLTRYNVITRGSGHDSFPTGNIAMLAQTGTTNLNSRANYVYNNTLVDNMGPGAAVADYGGGGGAGYLGANRWINNIVYDSAIRNRTAIDYNNTLTSSADIEDIWRNNLVDNPGGGDTVKLNGLASMTILEANALNLYPGQPLFDGNITGNPNFVSYTRGSNSNDYSLQNGSVAIDAGTNLTTVNSSDTGTGTSLIVNDARYFYDAAGFEAWQGVEADWIAVGNAYATSSKVQIASINYSTNTITLATSISRSNGDGVWLYRKSDGVQVVYGNAPDMGAFEYESGTSQTQLSTPQNLRFIVQ